MSITSSGTTSAAWAAAGIEAAATTAAAPALPRRAGCWGGTKVLGAQHSARSATPARARAGALLLEERRAKVAIQTAAAAAARHAARGYKALSAHNAPSNGRTQ